jgi:ATP-dependent DNA helicase RecQ
MRSSDGQDRNDRSGLAEGFGSAKDQARALLRRYWSYEAFRPGQWEVIAPAVHGRDVLALLATGSGKSICYQMAGLLRGGCTLVISPLVALMADQVAGLVGRGVPAFALAGQVSPLLYRTILSFARRDEPFFVFLAPERLPSKAFRRLLSHLDVRLLVVDEAHCVSEWGLTFRSSYRQMGPFRAELIAKLSAKPTEKRNANPQTEFNTVPLMALTATATPAVQRDMIRGLKLETPFRWSGSCDRSNLTFSVFHVPDAMRRLLDILDVVPGPAIVYDSTRIGVERWAARLQGAGISATSYHGGMRSAHKARNQGDWMRARCRVMVATNAFGMGIDRPDVRLVIHVGIPESLAAYFQEAGRGGRDGRPAHSVMLVTPEAIRERKRLAKGSARTEAVLKPMLRYIHSTTCRRVSLVRHFGETGRIRCRQRDGACDVCLERHEPFVPTPERLARSHGAGAPAWRRLQYEAWRIDRG